MDQPLLKDFIKGAWDNRKSAATNARGVIFFQVNSNTGKAVSASLLSLWILLAEVPRGSAITFPRQQMPQEIM
jgi:hypothetical protein